MSEVVDPIEWARSEAARLRSFQGSDVGGLLASAVEFLRTRAPKSAFYRRAVAILDSADNVPAIAVGSARMHHSDSLRRDMAQILDDWAQFVSVGLDAEEPFEVRARYEAATDLMEQVHLLLDDRNIHPAAPIVLAGAALEEALRGLCASHAIAPKGKAGIGSYSEALGAADILSRQQRKDVTAWAGLRNQAAHGEFDEFDRNAAQVMALGVNNFLSSLSK